MDLNQLTNLVQYLDEERRKDRTLVVQVQERVDSLSREVEARTRYAQSLETTINELRVQLPKAMIWVTAVEQVRNEFSAIIARLEDQRIKTERESVRIRQVEIESLVRQLNELKREVKPYSKYSEDIDARKVEEGRLSELISRSQVQLMDLERRFDAPGSQIAYLEEQRRQDTKRIVAVEQQLPDINRKIDQFPPKLLLLDEAIRRKQVELEEAAKIIEAQTQVLEAQRVADIRRERQFAEYAEVVEKLKQRADEVQQQVTGFIQMREEVRRVLSDVPEIGARLEVRINEIFEIQRDAEERAKRVADDFRESIQKEVRSFMVAQDEKWHPRDKRIADYEPRIEAVENELPRFEPMILPLYDLFEASMKAYARAGREWLAEGSTLLDKARLNLPVDNKLSRRQIRKRQAQQTADAAPIPNSNGNSPHTSDADADNEDDDILNEGLIQ